MNITVGMIVGLFGGLGGALFTLITQGWRERTARRRQAGALRALLVGELEMMWFDLKGSALHQSAKFFSCRTDIWDAYSQQILNLLSPAEVKTAYSAYYWAKEFQRAVSNALPIDYGEQSDRTRESVEVALAMLAGPGHRLVSPQENEVRTA